MHVVQCRDLSGVFARLFIRSIYSYISLVERRLVCRASHLSLLGAIGTRPSVSPRRLMHLRLSPPLPALFSLRRYVLRIVHSVRLKMAPNRVRLRRGKRQEEQGGREG